MSEHRSITVQKDMSAIVELWPALSAQVVTGGGGTEERVKGTRPSQLPIAADVVDLISEVERWVNFLARVLLDEVTGWTPAHHTMPGLLDDIARWRVGHFTEHPDQMLALSVADDASDLRKRVQGAVSPSGRRWVPLHVACLDYSTSDAGERVSCAGEYRALLDPEKPGLIPDMVCEADKAHRISPVDWQRAARKSGYDPTKIRERLALARGNAG